MERDDAVRGCTSGTCVGATWGGMTRSAARRVERCAGGRIALSFVFFLFRANVESSVGKFARPCASAHPPCSAPDGLREQPAAAAAAAAAATAALPPPPTARSPVAALAPAGYATPPLRRCASERGDARERAAPDGRAVSAARRSRRRRRRGRCRCRLGRRRTRSTQAAESPSPASAAGSAAKAARPGAQRALRILPGPARALSVQLRSHRGVDPLTPFPALRKARRCSGSLPRAVPPAARPSPLPSVRLSLRAARSARASACRAGARVGVQPV